METVNGSSLGVEDKGGPPPPSPLTGCYLLVVVGEPHSQEHKDIILQRIAKGLLSWDVNDCLVNLEKELSIITDQALEGEEARFGERLIQFASENLVTEILIHPAVSTLSQCVRNLLSSFTRHRHIIHAGYTFQGNGSWALQDGTFSYTDFSEAFQEIEVQRVIHAYENGISLHLHCSVEGEWTRLPKESFAKACKVRVNPTDVLTTGSPSILNFIKYLEPFLIPSTLENILESSDVVGNIRFSRPTLYVFPGGQGDAALFGINGFNMLLDGGYSRKACFWDFVRHLDRLDAVLMSRLNNSSISGIGSVLKRKKQGAVYPQIGHFFCNIQERKSLLSPDGDKDKDPLIISLLEEGQNLVQDLRQLNLSPQTCYKDNDPVILYHKVGHGTLNMYVLSPDKNSREVKDFLQKWNQSDPKLFASGKSGKEFSFPLQNLVSICALLVWQPANPNDTITRILYPGSTPQKKILEAFDKLKSVECIKHPVCSEKSLAPVKKTKQDVIDKLSSKDKIISDKKTENKIIQEESMKNGDIISEVKESKVKKSDSVESEKEKKVKKEDEGKKIEDVGKIVENGEKIKQKPRIGESKPKGRSESQQRKRPIQERKGPTTPKKTLENKTNGDLKEKDKKLPTKPSPSATPAKSTKDANNRRVIESKKAPIKKEATPKTAPTTETKHKLDRKPISRRPKTAKGPPSPVKKMTNGVQKPDSLSKRGKLDKEGTTDSSTVSTPSADQESILKKDIAKMTPEEIQHLKDRELEELKEEQEAVKEIEAVFRKGEDDKEEVEPGVRKIKDISIDDKLETEEYLIIEKEEIVDTTDQEAKEDEMQKLARDSEESEKQRKLSTEEKDIKIAKEEKEVTPPKEEMLSKVAVEQPESKKVPVVSPEEKVTTTTEKKETGEEEMKEVVESHPEEKISATMESGATTTAPTLPEDERITLDEIKEDNGQIIEEKHVKEETKEKEVPIIQLPPKSQQESQSKIPQVVGISLDKQKHIRDIVKTPDEVADLPVHEEADYHEFHTDEKKSNEIDVLKDTKKSEPPSSELKPTKDEKPIVEVKKEDSKTVQKEPEQSTTLYKHETVTKEKKLTDTEAFLLKEKIHESFDEDWVVVTKDEKEDDFSDIKEPGKAPTDKKEEIKDVTKEDQQLDKKEELKETKHAEQDKPEAEESVKQEKATIDMESKEKISESESDEDYNIRKEDEIQELLVHEQVDIKRLIEEADKKASVEEVDQQEKEEIETKITSLKEAHEEVKDIDEKLQELKKTVGETVEELKVSDLMAEASESEEAAHVPIKEDLEEIVKLDDKLQELKHTAGDSVEMMAEETVQSEPTTEEQKKILKELDIDKTQLGRKSPSEREEDVKKIVASVAEVLKSEAPLEELQGKLPFTQELRETHITTQDSPTTEKEIVHMDSIPPIEEETTVIPESEEKTDKSKRKDLLADARELMAESSKMISGIREKSEEKDSKETSKDDKDEDSGTVHRMLVTASSEDGGEEIEICPPGTITFSRSSESSGRSSPEPSQKTQSQKSSIVETASDTFSTIKQITEKDLEVKEDDVFEDKPSGFFESIKETFGSVKDAVRGITSDDESKESASDQKTATEDKSRGSIFDAVSEIGHEIKQGFEKVMTEISEDLHMVEDVITTEKDTDSFGDTPKEDKTGLIKKTDEIIGKNDSVEKDHKIIENGSVIQKDLAHDDDLVCDLHAAQELVHPTDDLIASKDKHVVIGGAVHFKDDEFTTTTEKEHISKEKAFEEATGIIKETEKSAISKVEELISKDKEIELTKTSTEHVQKPDDKMQETLTKTELKDDIKALPDLELKHDALKDLPEEKTITAEDTRPSFDDIKVVGKKTGDHIDQKLTQLEEKLVVETKDIKDKTISVIPDSVAAGTDLVEPDRISSIGDKIETIEKEVREHVIESKLDKLEDKTIHDVLDKKIDTDIKGTIAVEEDVKGIGQFSDNFGDSLKEYQQTVAEIGAKDDVIKEVSFVESKKDKIDTSHIDIIKDKEEQLKKDVDAWEPKLTDIKTVTEKVDDKKSEDAKAPKTEETGLGTMTDIKDHVVEDKVAVGEKIVDKSFGDAKISEDITKVETKIHDIKDEFVPTIDKIVETVKDEKKLEQQKGSTIDTTKDHTEIESTEKIGAKIDGTDLKDKTSFIGAIIDPIKDTILDAKDHVVQFAEKIEDKLSKTEEKIADETKILQKTEDDLKEKISDLKEQIVSKVDDIIDSTKESANTLADEIGKIDDKVSEHVEKTEDHFESKIADVKEKIEPQVESIVESAKDAIKVVDQQIKPAEENIDTTSEQIKHDKKEIKSDIKETTTSLMESTKDVVGVLVDQSKKIEDKSAAVEETKKIEDKFEIIEKSDVTKIIDIKDQAIPLDKVLTEDIIKTTDQPKHLEQKLDKEISKLEEKVTEQLPEEFKDDDKKKVDVDLKSVVDHTKDAVCTIEDKLTKQVEDTLSEATKIMHTTERDLDTKISEIKDQVSQADAVEVKIIKDSAEQIEKVKAIDKVEDKIKTAETKVGTVISDIKDEAVDHFDAVIDSSKGLIDMITDKFEKLEEKIEDKPHQAEQKISSQIDVVAKDSIGSEDKKIEPKEDKLSDKIEEPLTKITDTSDIIASHIDSVIDTVKDSYDVLADESKQLEDKLKAKVDEIEEQLVDKLPEISKTVQKVEDDIQTKVTDLKDVKESLVAKTDEVKAIADKLDKTGQKIEQTVTDLETKTTDKMQQLEEKVEKRYEELSDKVTTKLSDAFKEVEKIESDLTTKVTDTKDEIKPQVDDAIKHGKEFAESLLGKTKDHGEEVVEEKLEKVEDKLSKVEADLKTTLTDIKEQAVSKIDDFLGSTKDFVGSLIETKDKTAEKIAEDTKTFEATKDEILKDATVSFADTVKQHEEKLSTLGDKLTEDIKLAKTEIEPKTDKLSDRPYETVDGKESELFDTKEASAKMDDHTVTDDKASKTTEIALKDELAAAKDKIVPTSEPTKEIAITDTITKSDHKTELSEDIHLGKGIESEAHFKPTESIAKSEEITEPSKIAEELGTTDKHDSKDVKGPFFDEVSKVEIEALTETHMKETKGLHLEEVEKQKDEQPKKEKEDITKSSEKEVPDEFSKKDEKEGEKTVDVKRVTFEEQSDDIRSDQKEKPVDHFKGTEKISEKATLDEKESDEVKIKDSKDIKTTYDEKFDGIHPQTDEKTIEHPDHSKKDITETPEQPSSDRVETKTEQKTEKEEQKVDELSKTTEDILKISEHISIDKTKEGDEKKIEKEDTKKEEKEKDEKIEQLIKSTADVTKIPEPLSSDKAKPADDVKIEKETEKEQKVDQLVKTTEDITKLPEQTILDKDKPSQKEDQQKHEQLDDMKPEIKHEMPKKEEKETDRQLHHLSKSTEDVHDAIGFDKTKQSPEGMKLSEEIKESIEKDEKLKDEKVDLQKSSEEITKISFGKDDTKAEKEIAEKVEKQLDHQQKEPEDIIKKSEIATSEKDKQLDIHTEKETIDTDKKSTDEVKKSTEDISKLPEQGSLDKSKTSDEVKDEKHPMEKEEEKIVKSGEIAVETVKPLDAVKIEKELLEADKKQVDHLEKSTINITKIPEQISEAVKIEKDITKEDIKQIDQKIDLDLQKGKGDLADRTEQIKMEKEIIETEKKQGDQKVDHEKKSSEDVAKISEEKSIDKAKLHETEVEKGTGKDETPIGKEIDLRKTTEDVTKSSQNISDKDECKIEKTVTEKDEKQIDQQADHLNKSVEDLTKIAEPGKITDGVKIGKEVIEKSEKQIDQQVHELSKSIENLTEISEQVSFDKCKPSDEVKIAKETIEKSEKQIDQQVDHLSRSIEDLTKISEQVSFDKCKPSDEVKIEKETIEKSEKQIDQQVDHLSRSIEDLTKISEQVSFDKCKPSDEVKIEKETIEKSEKQIDQQVDHLSRSIEDLTKISEQVSFDKCKPSDEVKIEKETIEKSEKQIDQQVDHLTRSIEDLTKMSKQVSFDKCKPSDEVKIEKETIEKSEKQIDQQVDHLSRSIEDLTKISEQVSFDKCKPSDEVKIEKETIEKSEKQIDQQVDHLTRSIEDLSKISEQVSFAKCKPSDEVKVEKETIEKSEKQIDQQVDHLTRSIEDLSKISEQVSFDKCKPSGDFKVDKEVIEKDQKIIEERVAHLEHSLDEVLELAKNISFDTCCMPTKDYQKSDREEASTTTERIDSNKLADAAYSQKPPSPYDGKEKVDAEKDVVEDKKRDKEEPHDQDKYDKETKDVKVVAKKEESSLAEAKLDVIDKSGDKISSKDDVVLEVSSSQLDKSEQESMEKKSVAKESLGLSIAAEPKKLSISDVEISIKTDTKTVKDANQAFLDNERVGGTTDTCDAKIYIRPVEQLPATTTASTSSTSLPSPKPTQEQSGRTTPPTVPASPIGRDMKSPSSRMEGGLSEQTETDDDDLSTKSQVAHSQSDLDELDMKMDPMSMSFYGSLPGDVQETVPATHLYEITQARYRSAAFDEGEIVTKAEEIDLMSASFIGELPSRPSEREETAHSPAPSYLYEITKAKFTRPSEPDVMTASFVGELPSSSGDRDRQQPDPMTTSVYFDDPIASWGKPLGLPSPAPPNNEKGTPKKEKKLPAYVTAKNKLNDDRKRAESPSKLKAKKVSPVYVDLTYVPHHGNHYYSYVDFFKKVRARYYVFSGLEPSRQVYDALLEAKQTWEDKDLEVTIIPTYDTDILGYWIAENEELLSKFKIDLSPSASRCTINLQDHETSCSAYRLEF